MDAVAVENGLSIRVLTHVLMAMLTYAVIQSHNIA
jgi:hypothetical protein